MHFRSDKQQCTRLLIFTISNSAKKFVIFLLLIIHFLCINFMILSLGKLPFCLCVNQLNTCVYGIPYSKTQPAWQTRWMSQMSGDVEEREYWRNICLSLDQPWGKLNTVFNLIPFGLHEWALQIGKEWLNIHKSTSIAKQSIPW